MVIWYILAFLYFIAVDALIFFQQWNWLIIAIIAGVVFAFIVVVTKAFVLPASRSEPTPPPAAQQPDQQDYSVPSPQTMQAPVSNQQAASPFSIAMAFFYGEIVIIIGLVVFLFLKK